MLARMWSVRLCALAGVSLLAAACAPTLGPPPPGARPPPASASANFSAEAFAWSKAAGPNSIAGRLLYRQGATRYTCAGSSVVLTPETPWSRRRMAYLYGSPDRAALPADAVRNRTSGAPAGDAGPYVKRTTCDDADRFSFSGLPDGAWFVITIAKPADQAGDSVALMRRVMTRGGRAVALTL
jgi:hypothetical protein